LLSGLLVARRSPARCARVQTSHYPGQSAITSLTAWRSGSPGATYAPGVPNANWAMGDFDYNGFVDE
jgi:hypothetical protein